MAEITHRGKLLPIHVEPFNYAKAAANMSPERRREFEAWAAIVLSLAANPDRALLDIIRP